MQRNGNGPLVRWAAMPFPTSPGLEWRLYMSKIAAERLPFSAPRNRQRG